MRLRCLLTYLHTVMYNNKRLAQLNVYFHFYCGESEYSPFYLAFKKIKLIY